MTNKNEGTAATPKAATAKQKVVKRKKKLVGAKRKADTVVRRAFGEVQVIVSAMQKLKGYLDRELPKAYDMACKEHDIDPNGIRGNYKIFNQDETLQIDVSEQMGIAFDDILLNEAKKQLYDFIDDTLKDNAAFVADLVKSAFEASRGQLDSRKILHLLKFRKEIADERFQKGCDLIQEAQRQTQSKRYYRFSIKDDDGKYQAISLQFSHLHNTAILDII